MVSSKLSVSHMSYFQALQTAPFDDNILFSMFFFRVFSSFISRVKLLKKHNCKQEFGAEI